MCYAPLATRAGASTRCFGRTPTARSFPLMCQLTVLLLCLYRGASITLPANPGHGIHTTPQYAFDFRATSLATPNGDGGGIDKSVGLAAFINNESKPVWLTVTGMCVCAPANHPRSTAVHIHTVCLYI